MEERELINQIRSLKDVKPRKAWASSVRKEIVGPSVFQVLFQKNLAYAAAGLCLILLSVFALTLVSVPKEDNSALLAAAAYSKQNLGLVNQKIEVLTQVVKDNKVDENIVREINEDIAKASQTITKEIVQSPEALKEIINEIKQINQSKIRLETLGVIIDGDFQLNNVLQPLIEAEINNLDNVTLTEKQEMTLKEIKGLYEQGHYSDALEEILLIFSH